MQVGQLSKPSILVVDDTAANIKILADLLRRDYLLSVATSAPDALEIAFSNDRPDLVLLDIVMPDMDGYEVCRRLKPDPRTQDMAAEFLIPHACGREQATDLSSRPDGHY